MQISLYKITRNVYFVFTPVQDYTAYSRKRLTVLREFASENRRQAIHKSKAPPLPTLSESLRKSKMTKRPRESEEFARELKRARFDIPPNTTVAFMVSRDFTDPHVIARRVQVIHAEMDKEPEICRWKLRRRVMFKLVLTPHLQKWYKQQDTVNLRFDQEEIAHQQEGIHRAETIQCTSSFEEFAKQAVDKLDKLFEPIILFPDDPFPPAEVVIKGQVVTLDWPYIPRE